MPLTVSEVRAAGLDLFRAYTAAEIRRACPGLTPGAIREMVAKGRLVPTGYGRRPKFTGYAVLQALGIPVVDVPPVCGATAAQVAARAEKAIQAVLGPKKKPKAK